MSEIWEIARVDVEQHFSAAEPHLEGYPFRVLTRGKPKRRSGMPCLVRVVRSSPQVTPSRIPVAFCEVAIDKRIASARHQLRSS
jgi:hypothetical protein